MNSLGSVRKTDAYTGEERRSDRLGRHICTTIIKDVSLGGEHPNQNLYPHLVDMLEVQLRFDDEALVEAFISGDEFERIRTTLLTRIQNETENGKVWIARSTEQSRELLIRQTIAKVMAPRIRAKIAELIGLFKGRIEAASDS